VRYLISNILGERTPPIQQQAALHVCSLFERALHSPYVRREMPNVYAGIAVWKRRLASFAEPKTKHHLSLQNVAERTHQAIGIDVRIEKGSMSGEKIG
jgi:hypothetical protein